MTITFAIDGAPLDHPLGYWQIESATSTGQPINVRAVNQVVPGFDGVMPVAYETLDVPPQTIVLVVNGDGVGGESDVGLQRNINALSGLFQNAALLTKTVDGVSRTAVVRLGSLTAPEYSPDASARITAVLRLPKVYWRGPTGDYSRVHPPLGGVNRVTTLDGSSGPVDDALILITGPITNPRVTDLNSGEWVQANFAVAAGEKLLINCATWQARRGTAVTYAGGGSIVSQALSASKGRAALLRLTPAMTAGNPLDTRVTVSLTGTGDNADTTLGIRAQPAFFS